MQEILALLLWIRYHIKMKIHIKHKRDEIIWALSQQDYTFADIGEMFKLNASTVFRIIKEKPKDWKPKWIKQ
tara:strand:+ start:1578 stop:1793 length:216 start_codon:yes stop_codon:yes gene_type:complete